jgi:hypothetical protein
MITTDDLLRTIQLEREAQIRNDQRARSAACARTCCNPSLLDRVARALGGNPASC